MRIIMKAVASTATVGLLAFGAVAASGGAAFAAPNPNPYTLVAGCTTAVADVTVGYVPNCTSVGGTIVHPNTSIVVGVQSNTDVLDTLILGQAGQGFQATWDLVCSVDGTTVTAPGNLEITSTTQSPFTTIDLQQAVGSPDPNQCAIESLDLQTILPLNVAEVDKAVPFEIGVGAEATTAVGGAIHQDEGTTSAGAHAALCADDTANGNAGSKIQAFQCLTDLADYFVQTATGQLVHNGDCVSVTAGGVVLAKCVANDTLQRWTQSTAGGTVKNQSTGTCLTAPSVKDGTQLTVKACGSGANQQWDLPAVTAVPIAPTISALGAALYRK
jgi:Ricin-type beta-trefoil lectin domain